MATAAAPVSTEDLLATLTEGIAQLTTTGAWIRWLTAQRRFRNYSFNNCMLIALQNPDATHVAGFTTWKSLNRSVRKGERGIRILAPITRTTESTNDTGDVETVRRLVAFRPVATFDISQTDGEQLPPPPVARLDGDAPEAAWEQLAGITSDVGFELVVTPCLPGERNGDCDFAARRIRVRETLSPAQQIKTLTHELAHAILHADCSSERSVAELEAESVAFIVCGSGFGLDTSAYSFGYVATWAGGSSEAIEGIRRSGQRIAAASGELLDRLLAAGWNG